MLNARLFIVCYKKNVCLIKIGIYKKYNLSSFLIFQCFRNNTFKHLHLLLTLFIYLYVEKIFTEFKFIIFNYVCRFLFTLTLLTGNLFK